jgi:glycosyltransferase involved in cell wall biosynthesis
VVSHGESATGYARVTGELLPRLAADFDCTLFAVNFRGQRSVPGYRIAPNVIIGDGFGQAQLPRLLAEIEPDLVLVHHDLAFLSAHADTLAEYRRSCPRARTLAYCPIDVADTPAAHVRQLQVVDVAVCFSAFGHRITEAALAGLTRRPTAAIIPHGVDQAAFGLRLDRDEARGSCFPGLSGLSVMGASGGGAFIVLNANRATPRKRLDLTLAAFARFARGKDDVYLSLNPTAFEPWTGIVDLATRLRVADRLLFPEPDVGPWRLSDARLAQLYAACDVGLTTTTGEAWGLVAFEHAACGAAQVMPAHSACAELWSGAAMLCALDATAPASGVVDVAATAAALDDLYASPARLAAMSARARRRAFDPALSWDAVADRWRCLLTGLLSGPHINR